MYSYVGGNPINYIDPYGLKTWILASQSVQTGYGIFSFESGNYFLIDPDTRIVHEYYYVSGGLGLSAKLPIKFAGSAQFEFGLYDGPCDVKDISDWSLAVSAFVVAKYGLSGQVTGTSFWGGGDIGASYGPAAGIGAGISGLLTRSWYQGSSDIIPETIKDGLIEFINLSF